MKLREHELLARARLMEAGVDSPGLCARLLVAYAAGIPRDAYLLADNQELSASGANHLSDLLSRRAAGEPLAYLLGRKEFYADEFQVGPATLVPRPETELLVELALSRLGNAKTVFVDVGCGCGCIGLSLLAARPAWAGILVDCSPGALAIAAHNATCVAPRAVIMAADIFCLPFAPESLDLLVSNPPYVAIEEIDQVMPEVLAFEPHGALFSSNHGLAHIEALVTQACKFLRKGGLLLIEHGATQAGAVRKILLDNNFSNCEDYVDLAGLPRCALAVRT